MKLIEIKSDEEIKAILCHPEIYPRISDDRSPPPIDFDPPDSAKYIAGYVDGDIIGLMVYHKTDLGLKCHFQVLPEYRQKYSREFARMALDFGEAKNASIYAEVADCYPDVIRFAKDMGFKREGYAENVSIKNGVSYRKVLLRLNRCHS